MARDDVTSETDFFKSGAGSMDVTRLVEEVKEKCGGISLQTEEVYMATTLEDFIKAVVLKGRGVGQEEFKYDAVSWQDLLSRKRFDLVRSGPVSSVGASSDFGVKS